MRLEGASRASELKLSPRFAGGFFDVSRDLRIHREPAGLMII